MLNFDFSIALRKKHATIVSDICRSMAAREISAFW